MGSMSPWVTCSEDASRWDGKRRCLPHWAWVLVPRALQWTLVRMCVCLTKCLPGPPRPGCHVCMLGRWLPGPECGVDPDPGAGRLLTPSRPRRVPLLFVISVLARAHTHTHTRNAWRNSQNAISPRRGCEVHPTPAGLPHPCRPPNALSGLPGHLLNPLWSCKGTPLFAYPALVF